LFASLENCAAPGAELTCAGNIAALISNPEPDWFAFKSTLAHTTDTPEIGVTQSY